LLSIQKKLKMILKPCHVVNYTGFSVIKEFYSPDYVSKSSLNTKEDKRITLYWRPNIFLNHVNPVIPVNFYNNDRTKSFKVVVEGMTNTGKLIFIEKTIDNATLKAF